MSRKFMFLAGVSTALVATPAFAQSVPVSVAALGAEAIVNGTFAFSIGVEPSVAVIIDDMPVVQQAQAFDNLTDLARIEVLKGPQGTLFGKNASAGVVNIVTKNPDKVLGGSVSFTAASPTKPAHVTSQFHTRDSERHVGMKIGISF